MAIVIRSQGSDSLGDMIRKFKKATVSADVVQVAKDRRYYQKPSQVRAQKQIAKNRLRRKAHSLRKRKNISSEAIERIWERIQG